MKDLNIGEDLKTDFKELKFLERKMERFQMVFDKAEKNDKLRV